MRTYNLKQEEWLLLEILAFGNLVARTVVQLSVASGRMASIEISRISS